MATWLNPCSHLTSMPFAFGNIEKCLRCCVHFHFPSPFIPVQRKTALLQYDRHQVFPMCFTNVVSLTAVGWWSLIISSLWVNEPHLLLCWLRPCLSHLMRLPRPLPIVIKGLKTNPLLHFEHGCECLWRLLTFKCRLLANKFKKKRVFIFLYPSFKAHNYVVAWVTQKVLKTNLGLVAIDI